MIGVGIIAALIIALLTMIIFKKSSSGKWIVYLITKGQHRSESSAAIFPSTIKIRLAPKTVKFSAMFCDGCDYDNRIVGDAINKLYGVSYGFDHHYRSVRIGWRSNRNLGVIELFVYAYVDGRRYIKKLINVTPFEQIDVTIFHTGKLCVIELKTEDGQRVTESVKVSRGWINWTLFPYFGGRTPAPDHIKVLIRR